MTNRTLLTAVAVLLTAVAWPALAQPDDAPNGQFIEAESMPGADQYGEIVDDDDASGGQAVTSGQEWRPVLRYALGDDLPDRITIHVLRKGGPLQLKARVDGKNKELKWNWSKPSEYKWTSFGTYDRETLGDRIEIIRGKGDGPRIDAIVLQDAGGGAAGAKPGTHDDTDNPQNAAEAGVTGDAAGDDASGLPPVRPRAGLPARSVDLTVDWSADRGDITPAHWGVATYSMADVGKANDPGFINFLATLRPGLVRVHHSGLADKWSNETTRSWDVDRIRGSLAPMKHLPDASLMVTLPNWPEWFSNTKAIEVDRYSEAEELMRDWVRAVREASPVPVTHFEVFNEFDNTWEKKGRIDELWPLFARLARAVKQEAPDAKVGGPAFTWAQGSWVKPFLDEAGETIDFVSWHNYAGGKPTATNEAVLGRIGTLADHAANVKRWLGDRGLDHVETYLNEYNVQWTWTPYERRHANQLGAALQAGVIARCARLGVTGLAVWHAKGNAYGLIDEDNRLRAPGQMFLLGREHLVGDLASVDASDDAPVEALAVVDADGRRSLMLINTAEAPVKLASAAALLDLPSETDGSMHRLDHAGWTVSPLSTSDDVVSLPGWSITLLTQRPTKARWGTVTLPGQDVEFDF